MAICRYVVQCPGCDAIIHLRISVGLDDEQPFYFVCDRCNAATRGKQIVTYAPVPTTQLELEAGKQVETESSANQVINIHPELPARAEAAEMWEEGGSPFLMHAQILGDRFEQFHKRVHLFRDSIDAKWVGIKRWFGFYIDENWERFDEEGSRLFEDSWESPKSELQRHDAFHRTLSLATAPLWISNAFPAMKEDFVKSLLKAYSEARQAFVDLARAAVETGEIESHQRDVFHCLDQFIEHRRSILPGLAVAMYPAGQDSAIRELRLFRDDFPKLRDLYISSFETCHHTLKYVAGTINIAERGDPDNFPASNPRDLDTFSRLPNARKLDPISSLSQ